MSRASINTSSVVFKASESSSHESKIQSSTAQNPLKVVIIGDFSGRASRGVCTIDDIHQRPIVEVNKDNFESVFSRMRVRLQLPVCEDVIELMEFDDLHPDYLYSRVPLFQRFIDLNKRLLDPVQLPEVANEIATWKTSNTTDEKNLGNSDEGQSAQSLLASILHSAQSRDDKPLQPASFSVDQLIEDIIAPYVTSQDPRQPELLAAIDNATSETMRTLMHQSDYQQLEASWRSIQMLVKRLPLGSDLRLHLLDVSKDELLADLGNADSDLEQAQIFHRVVTTQAAEGLNPFDILLGDFYINEDEQDLGLLVDMGTIAQATDSCFISAANSALAGFPSLASNVDPQEWRYDVASDFKEGWSAVRDFSASEHIALASPRFMLRLPYGNQTATTDCFEFEELATNGTHRYYLWGNSGYLVTLLLCENAANHGINMALSNNNTVADLPLHHYKQQHESTIKPCAETLLTDSAAHCFVASGITPIRSVNQQDRVVLANIQSLHVSGELKGPWNRV